MAGERPLKVSVGRQMNNMTHALQTDQCRVCPSRRAEGAASVQQLLVTTVLLPRALYMRTTCCTKANQQAQLVL